MPTRTADQRRAEERDAFLRRYARCPTGRVLERIGDRWSGRLLTELRDGSQRHGELARSVPGVTQKMLTQTLRSLERDGLVWRTVTASVPPRADYGLTEPGRALLPVIDAATHWSDRYLPEVESANARFDTARPPD